MKAVIIKEKDIDNVNAYLKDYFIITLKKRKFFSGKADEYTVSNIKFILFSPSTGSPVSIIQKLLINNSYNNHLIPGWGTNEFNILIDKELSKLDYLSITIVNDSGEDIKVTFAFFANKEIIDKIISKFQIALGIVNESKKTFSYVSQNP